MGTTVPFPRALSPALQFKTEIVGGTPSGQAIRFPALFGVTIVNWKETARAVSGIPHGDGVPGTVPAI
jgi:hypothetical protein